MEAFPEIRERIARARTALVYSHLAPAVSLATGLPQPASLPDYTASCGFGRHGSVITLKVGEGRFTLRGGCYEGVGRVEVVGLFPRAVEETFVTCIYLFAEHATGDPGPRTPDPEDIWPWGHRGELLRSIARRSRARESESEIPRRPDVAGPADADAAGSEADGAGPDADAAWPSGDDYDCGFSETSGGSGTHPNRQPTRRQVMEWMFALTDFTGNTWGIFPLDDHWRLDAARRLAIWGAPVPTARPPVATFTARISDAPGA